MLARHMRSVMEKIQRWGIRHSIAVLVGIGVAIIIASPHLRAYLLVGEENFRGVHVQFSDDEVTYQARIKEVVEGNLVLGNPYIKEHMNDSFIMPPLAEWTVGFFAWITGTSVPFVTSVSDGVLGFIGFLLTYMLFHILTRSMWISLLYTLVFFFFSLATFGRPISPQFNALFLFTGLIVITKIYFNPSLWGRKWNLFAGLITGVTCFISPYYFTALLGFYVLVFLSRAIFERNMESIKRNAPWFFIAFLPLALVYAFFQLKAAQDPSYSETVLRYGLLHTHIPGSFTNVLFGSVAFSVLALCFKSLQNQKFAFSVGTLVTLFALNWQNILTGKSLQFSSHYLFVSILLIFISFALIHTALVTREMVNLGRMRRFLIIGGMAFLLVVIGHNQKGEFINLGKTLFTREELLEEQKKMEVFNWFNANTRADSVVYTLGGKYDFLLPIYTENKVFYNFYAALYPASDRETEERWLIQHYFDGDMSSTTIRDSQRDFWGNKYIDTYQSSENRKKIQAFLMRTDYVPGEMILNERIDYMYKRFQEMRTIPIEIVFTKYKIEYVLLSNDYSYADDVEKQLGRMTDIKFIIDLGEVKVYKFQPE